MTIMSNKRIPYLQVTIHMHSTNYVASFIWTSTKNE